MFMVATSSFVALNPNAGKEVPSNPTIVFTTYEKYEAEIAQRMLTTRSVVWRVVGERWEWAREEGRWVACSVYFTLTLWARIVAVLQNFSKKRKSRCVTAW
jgi:hypothetical protein